MRFFTTVFFYKVNSFWSWSYEMCPEQCLPQFFMELFKWESVSVSDTVDLQLRGVSDTMEFLKCLLCDSPVSITTLWCE